MQFKAEEEDRPSEIITYEETSIYADLKKAKLSILAMVSTINILKHP